MNQGVTPLEAPQPVTDVEAWLRANNANMHTCPLLPGKAKITAEACRKRRGMAIEINNRRGNEALFDGGGPMGLATCLECAKGLELGDRS